MMLPSLLSNETKPVPKGFSLASSVESSPSAMSTPTTPMKAPSFFSGTMIEVISTSLPLIG